MKNSDYILLFDKFLQQQATPEEVRQLIEWLKNDAAFGTWADAQWEAASSDMNPEVRQRLFRQIQGTIQPQAKTRAVGRWTFYAAVARVAATLLLMLATGLCIYFYTVRKLTMPDMVVAVEKGQKANVILPDGSKVWVNSDSRLTYGSRFNSHERILHLEGEAYFEVAPDKERPFIVETNQLSVQALGTSFDVKNYEEEDHISTVLMTGKVKVESEKNCIFLEPNEKVTFNKTTGSMRKSTIENARRYADWKFNLLSFQAETFERIVHTLERYYNTRIVFESESLKKYRFTGSIGNTSLESVLQILSLTSPLTYEVRDSVILLRENIKQKAYYENALK